jgi:hypothetical protein
MASTCSKLDEIVESFSTLEDPRSHINRRHPLPSILVIAVLGLGLELRRPFLVLFELLRDGERREDRRQPRGIVETEREIDPPVALGEGDGQTGPALVAWVAVLASDRDPREGHLRSGRPSLESDRPVRVEFSHEVDGT